MKIPFVDLKAQYLSIKKEIDEAISDVLENTAFIGGPPVEYFKSSFEEYYGVSHCVPCGNGTDALYICMKMLGIGNGDEVITTASSWISTSETITQAGAKPIFVDIDEYYTIDSKRIEEKITSKTKAIIPVHLYGQMCDMPDIMKIAKKHDLVVIEDCAQSHLSSLNLVRAGLWGNVGTFSFYPGKNLGAYGDAGCIITNNSQFAQDCQRYANHGALVKHQHDVEGINSRMDALQAAVLRVKLPYLENWTNERVRVASLYTDLLDGVEGIQLPHVRKDSLHSFHVFGIKTARRDELRKYLQMNGVPAQIHYPVALPLMRAYEYLGHTKEEFPNSYELQEMELSLPIYPEMKDEQVEFVADMIKGFN